MPLFDRLVALGAAALTGRRDQIVAPNADLGLGFCGVAHDRAGALARNGNWLWRLGLSSFPEPGILPSRRSPVDVGLDPKDSSKILVTINASRASAARGPSVRLDWYFWTRPTAEAWSTARGFSRYALFIASRAGPGSD